MELTEDVIEELDTMERMTSNLNSTGAEPYWICDNCDIRYRPALVPGEEDKHPRCPQCYNKPAIADII